MKTLLRRTEILHRRHIGRSNVPAVRSLRSEEIRHARYSSPHEFDLEDALIVRGGRLTEHARAILLLKYKRMGCALFPTPPGEIPWAPRPALFLPPRGGPTPGSPGAGTP